MLSHTGERSMKIMAAAYQATPGYPVQGLDEMPGRGQGGLRVHLAEGQSKLPEGRAVDLPVP